MMAVALLLVPIAIGLLLVHRLMPEVTRWTDYVWRAAIGTGVGIGLTSTLYFVFLWLGIGGRFLVLGLDGALLVALVLFAMRSRRSGGVGVEAGRPSLALWGLRAAALASLVILALNVYESFQANPLGEFDALACWNRKAKFLAAGPEVWRDMNRPYGAAHPGYGLLIPGAIARAWTLSGTGDAPAAVGIVFTLAVVGLLLGAAGSFRGEASGLVMVIVLLAGEGFVSQAAIEYADIPLSLFILATISLLALAERHDWHPGVLLLAGLCAGLGAWTKDEGVPFLVLALMVGAWRVRRKVIAWMFAGAAPLVALVAAYKLTAGRSTDPFVAAPAELTAQVTNAGRYFDIVVGFLRSFWDLGPVWAHPVVLVAVLLWAIGRVAKEERHGWLLAPIAGLVVVECVIYLVSPNNLAWYLGASNSRLVAQIWPALLLLGCLAMRPIELPVAPVGDEKRSGGSVPGVRRRGGRGAV